MRNFVTSPTRETEILIPPPIGNDSATLQAGRRIGPESPPMGGVPPLGHIHQYWPSAMSRGGVLRADTLIGAAAALGGNNPSIDRVST